MRHTTKQQETQMQTESFHLESRSAGRTTDWAQKLIFTQPFCQLQKRLQYSSHRNSTEKSKKFFGGGGWGGEKTQETKEHYTNSCLLLINRIVLTWCKGRLATAWREVRTCTRNFTKIGHGFQTAEKGKQNKSLKNVIEWAKIHGWIHKYKLQNTAAKG